ncbi:27444_t:CDS:2 [Dentiscutata erythropus]|uniref:27444_t:CDS:1 n=1 Tax=Dentiscutata erythropus TaxID=1348616 RepID=A0A9N9BLX4_9GLOM|nr:27444_t:CDS:2 [Dentiscutata erythropus]
MTTTVKPSGSILDVANKDGEIRRKPTTFCNTISKDPDAIFTPEKDRYHLYIGLSCPFAQRTAIVRALKGLEDTIGLSIVDYFFGEKGWKFSTPEETPGCIPDIVNNAQYLSELYFKANPDYDGRYTVPVLWDKKLQTIVNNESSEIIRIFNDAFDDFVSETKGKTFYPKHLASEIDKINDSIYNKINNNLYKCGFAETQDAYMNHIGPLFDALDDAEAILSKNEFLAGNTFTEVDVKVWTFIIRFDPVYHTLYKTNLKTIKHDYPNILRWARQIYKIPKVADTVNMTHIKNGSYKSKKINPHEIVPVYDGPGT